MLMNIDTLSLGLMSQMWTDDENEEGSVLY